MKSVLARIPAFRLGRRLGRPLVLPASLTFNVLYACNSRCKTCFIYENRARVLTGRRVRSDSSQHRPRGALGHDHRRRAVSAPRPARDRAQRRPAIATRRWSTSRPTAAFPIASRTWSGGSAGPGAELVDHQPLDRRRRGGARRAPPLRGQLGAGDANRRACSSSSSAATRIWCSAVNTVVSRFNEHRIGEIAERVEQIAPDSYVAEVAGQRVELGTARAGITPSKDGVLQLSACCAPVRRRTLRLVEALVAALREEYYHVLERYTTERRQVLPCYAGITSAHIMPEGKVWACCVLGEELGDLRETDYDFPTIWYGAAARHDPRAHQTRALRLHACRTSLTSTCWSIPDPWCARARARHELARSLPRRGARPAVAAMAERVLLTGATGFIGRGWRASFRPRAFEFRCVVCAAARRESRAARADSPAGFARVICSIRAAIAAAVREPDVVVHLAALGRSELRERRGSGLARRITTRRSSSPRARQGGRCSPLRLHELDRGDGFLVRTRRAPTASAARSPPTGVPSSKPSAGLARLAGQTSRSSCCVPRPSTARASATTSSAWVRAVDRGVFRVIGNGDNVFPLCTSENLSR